MTSTSFAPSYEKKRSFSFHHTRTGIENPEILSFMKDVVDQAKKLLKQGDDEAFSYNINLIVSIARSNTYALNEDLVSDIITLTLTGVEKQILSDALLYDIKTMSSREKLFELHIQICMIITNLAFKTAQSHRGNDKAKHLKRALDECSLALLATRKHHLYKFQPEIYDTLGNIEMYFIHYMATEVSLFPELKSALEQRNIKYFTKIWRTLESLTKYFAARKKFDMARSLFDAKKTGELLLVMGFESFVSDALRIVSDCNKAQLSSCDKLVDPEWMKYINHLDKIRQAIPNNHIRVDKEGNLAYNLVYETQMTLTENYSVLIHSIVRFAMTIIGPAPYAFCILALGSHSRGETFPYSDLEFAMLLETDKDDTDDNFPKSYFGRFLDVFDFLVNCIGEPTGFRLDAQGTAKEYRFRGTPAKIVNKIFSTVDIQSIPLVFSMMHPVCIYANDDRGHALFDDYLVRSQEINLKTPWKDDPSLLYHKGFALCCIHDHLRMLKKKWGTPTDGKISIKEHYLMPLTCILNDLSIYYCYPITNTKYLSSIKIAQTLAEEPYNVFNIRFSKSVVEALASLFSIRMRLELCFKEQIDYETSIDIEKINDEDPLSITTKEKYWIDYSEWTVKRPIIHVLPYLIEHLENPDSSRISLPVDPALLNIRFELQKLHNKPEPKKVELKTPTKVRKSVIVKDDYILEDDERVVPEIPVPYDLLKSLAWTLSLRNASIREHMDFYRQFPDSWRSSYRSCILGLENIYFNLKHLLHCIDTYPSANGHRILSTLEYKEWCQRASEELKPIQRSYKGSFETTHTSFMTLDTDNDLATFKLCDRLFYRSVAKKHILSASQRSSTEHDLVYVVEKVRGITLDKAIKENSPDRSIDLNSFSTSFILSILLMHGDGKPDNYILERFKKLNINMYGDSSVSYRLVMEFHRHSCADFLSIACDEIRLLNNILFCMDQMKAPVDELVVAELLEMDIYEVIQAWILDLAEVEREYESNYKSTLPIFIHTNVLPWIYQTLGQIQKLLREKKRITHLEVLRAIHPVHGSFCTLLFQEKDDVMDRYETMSEGLHVNDVYTMLEKSYQIKDFVLNANGTLSTNELLDQLENIKKIETKQIKLKKRIQVANNYELSSKIEKMDSATYQTVINHLDFNEVPTSSVVETLLHYYEPTKPCCEIVFKNCHQLDNSRLESILKNSNFIIQLELSGCKRLGHRNLSQNDVLKIISENCPQLITLDMSDSPIKQFALLNNKITNSTADIYFHRLEWLNLDNCPNIDKIKMVAPKLRHLDARNCPLLSTIEVSTNRLATANFQGCWKISCRMMIQKNLNISKMVSALMKLNPKKKNEYIGDFEKIVSHEIQNEYVIPPHPLTNNIIECYMLSFSFNDSITKIILDSVSINDDNMSMVINSIIMSNPKGLKEVVFRNATIKKKNLNNAIELFKADGRYNLHVVESDDDFNLI